MKLYCTILIFSIISCFGFSQQIKLRGQVSIHNSKYNTGTIQYVKDAYITAPFTKADNTDDSGRFELEFVEIDAGTAVKVQVEKTGSEVVNEYDLQRVIISMKLPLRVYLTTKGQLAIAQTELYNISMKALFVQKDALIARLNASAAESQAAIAELEVTFGQEIANLYEAEDLLNTKIEELQKRLPEFAQNLAVQNLDFASDTYIEAFEYFKKGDIKKAIDVLDDAKLEQSYIDATKNITEGKKLENIGKDLQEKGLLQINQIINSYDLKAESFILLFKYGDAAQIYEKIIKIHEANQFDEGEIIVWYEKAAHVYRDDGEYLKALDYHKKAIAIVEEIIDPKHPDLAYCYDGIATIYADLGNYQKALAYQQKAIAIEEEILDPPSLAMSYNNVALIYHDLADFQKALVYQQKAIAIKEEILDPTHPSLAMSYSNIALIYHDLGDYQKALAYQQKAIAIREKILDPKHPDLAISYNNIAPIYLALGNYTKALAYQLKAIAIQEKILNPTHPTLAISYSNIADIYQHSYDYQEALVYQQKAIAIQEKNLDPKHPYLAASYSNIAIIYQDLNDYPKALAYIQKSIAIIEEILDPKHPNLATDYNNIAIIYQDLHDYPKALVYQQKAIAILEEILDSRHPDLAESYFDIAIIYYEIGDYKKSIKYYSKAAKIDPEFHSTYYSYFYNDIGLAFVKNRQFDKAKKVFRKYEKLHPKDGISFLNWAEYYALQNDKEKALLYLQKAVDFGYDDLRWIKRDRSLDSIRNEAKYNIIIEQLEK
jgi:tetratricopeptide (TPR) repeat protein